MKTSKVLYTIVGILGILIGLGHEAVGTADSVDKLAGTGLDELTIQTLRWSWHVDIVGPLTMAGLVLIGARVTPGKWLTTTAFAISAAYASAALFTAVMGSPAFWGSPAPYVWTAIAVVNALALSADKRGYTMLAA